MTFYEQGIEISIDLVDRMSIDELVEVTESPLGTYENVTMARVHRRLGSRPIPVCDPDHQFVTQAHADGHTDEHGRWHPGCQTPGKVPVIRRWQRFSHLDPTDAELNRVFRFHPVSS